MKIGLALAGGGARGISHLGVIKALEEAEIEVTALAGTSAGSIVSSLYSYGYSPDEILEIVEKTKVFKLLRPALNFRGLLTIDSLGETMKEYLPENDFGALKKPTTIVATELRTGKSAYFNSGELIRPIMASCCIPVVFNPVEFDGGVYVDGGILNNLPAEPLVDSCDFIIGSDCNPIDNNFKMSGVRTVIERSLLLAINGNNDLSRQKCDVIVTPPGLKNISGFELGKAREIFEFGYYSTKEMTPEIQSKIEAFTKEH